MPIERSPLPGPGGFDAPPSLASRWDVALLGATPGSEYRAAAAALGLCWTRFRRHHPYPGNALQYGGHVIDTLLGQGYPMGEILVAGNAAADFLAGLLVNVEGAADFSAPPGGPDGTASGGGSTSTST